MTKQLWVLAGGNGSGKSTFFDRFLKPLGLSFVNADMIAAEISDKVTTKVSKQAQLQALKVFEQKLTLGETFCFETVFSHSSKIDLIKQAKTMGYEVNLVFIHLNSFILNEARVIQRVNSGGHNVPKAKIKSRIPRTIENIKMSLLLVDNAKLIDNSSIENPFMTMATVKNQKLIYKINPSPPWLDEILEKLP